MILVHHRSSAVIRRPRQRGVIVPLTALSLVSVLLVATLVIDGSQAYPQRRTAQNAADNAALAGARALDKKKFFSGTEDVYAAAAAVAEDNGSTLVDCWFIKGTKTGGTVDKASDPTCDPGDPIPPDAFGVQVRTTNDRFVTFSGVNDREKVQARAEASATVQKLVSSGSPFIVCGNPKYAGKRDEPVDILKSTGPLTDPTFVYNADGTVDVDPDKVDPDRVDPLNAQNGGRGIILQDSQVPTCGLDSNDFKGKGFGDTVTVPGLVSYTNGNGNNNSTAEQVLTANPCPDPFPAAGTEVLCDIILPIAIGSEGDKLEIVALGVFKVSGNGRSNPKYYGRYVANASQVSGGITTTEPVTAGTLRVIGLIQ